LGPKSHFMCNLNILFADDDKDDCLFFDEALKELQLAANLTIVRNGDQLMQLLQTSTCLPDILFLDLNMPRKNGLTCLEEIKQDERLKHIPVVICSTSYQENIAERLYKTGAHHYICKPVDFSSLKQVIDHAIQLTLKEKESQPAREKFLISNMKTILR